METKFQTIEGKSTGFYALLAVLALLGCAGVLSTYLMYRDGIYLSGMTNRIPWGLQIIFCVFYIGLSAGSLVISSLYGVFGKSEYKPFARIAVFLAFLFLVGALLSIMSDWGRLDRIFNPFMYFNPQSMLSINPFLYSIYMLICVVYLTAMLFEMDKWVKIIAVIAVVWAIGVHSGTGAIFGFVPRELYQSPLSPPSFISAALSSGTAFMILMILGLFRVTKKPLEKELVVRLGRLLGIFVVVVVYFIFVENAYRYYLLHSREASLYFLFDNIIGLVFWGGMIVIGSVLPAALLFYPKTGRSIPWIVVSAICVVVGVFCERYLIVIPGQAHPPVLFPNMEIVTSAFEEGVVVYSISALEIVQAVGVVGIIGFAFALGLKVLKLLPAEARLHDVVSENEHSAKQNQ